MLRYVNIFYILISFTAPLFGMRSLARLLPKKSFTQVIAGKPFYRSRAPLYNPRAYSIPTQKLQRTLMGIPTKWGRHFSNGYNWKNQNRFTSTNFSHWASKLFGLFTLSTAASLILEYPAASIWEKYAQDLPVSYNDMKKSFIHDCKKYESRNAQIPAHNDNKTIMRSATYNVHGFTDPYGNHNFEKIMATIKDINADILVLQEVKIFDQKRIAQAFEDLGYRFDLGTFGRTTNNIAKPFGNMILIKKGIEHTSLRTKTFNVDQNHPHERRCYITTTISLPSGQKINFYATHLDVWDRTEKKRTQELRELINTSENQENVIVAADFNAIRRRDYDYEVLGKNVFDMHSQRSKNYLKGNIPLQALATFESHNFNDCFASNRQQFPKFTTWAGTCVDYMYLKKWNLPISGCYTYYSPASDHLPIIMDITL